MQQPDGTVRAVYVHHDAYVAGVGAILGGWYETREKVEALLALGDLSSLGTTLADTVAYHRDRGEDMRTAKHYRDIGTYRRNGRRDFGADYLYLYDGEKWFVYGIADEDWIELQVTVNQEEK
ncbi:MAG: hypothetical protein BWY31_04653 [Lentisphaerae bacterium ADurb.Bin242]|nr:MAG: hypothetical protein BWY31_04653 [Lentisphaerae bacterium ADurb.Bin242]